MILVFWLSVAGYKWVFENFATAKENLSHWFNIKYVVLDHTMLGTTDKSHSFHLHGYSFYVVGESRKAFIQSADHAKKLDGEARLVRRELDRSVLKNTVVVPAAGVSAVRFIADNPGVYDQ